MKAAIMPEAGKIELVDVVLPEMQDVLLNRNSIMESLMDSRLQEVMKSVEL